MHETTSMGLGHAVALLAAMVVAATLFRRFGLGALTFGYQVLIDLGFTGDQARETIADVRRRDAERLTLQLSGGLQAGRALMRGNAITPQPEPYIKPRREGQALNEEAAEVLEEEEARAR